MWLVPGNAGSMLSKKAEGAMREKLLIGLLVDSNQIPHWAYAMIQKIVGSNYAEITLVVQKDEGCLARNKQYRNNDGKFEALFFSIAYKLDKLIYRLEPNAFEPKNLHQVLPNVSWIVVDPIQKGHVEYLRPEDCAIIQSCKLDVLIKLGFDDLRGEVLSAPQYGVWAHWHGDNRINQVGPVGFWEVFEGRGETGSMLQILANDPNKTKVIYESFAQTDSLSVGQNNNNNYWKTVSFIPRKLQEIHALGEESLLARIKLNNQHPYFYSRPIYAVPQKSEWIRLVLRHLLKIITRSIQRCFYFDQYILLYAINKGKMLSPTLSRYKQLIPPPDRFWADPFIIYEDRKYYVFVEEVMAQNNKGHISYLTIDENEKVSLTKKIIEKPYHMSYPFIFSYNNEYYMIPETSANKTIELYKCVDFPDKWELKMTLMENVQAFDATVLRKNGKWWLFANIRENEQTSSFDELFLFYSEDLFSGNWTPHVKNPIVSDVRSARPAGNIFEYNGNLYRPSQNSSKIYGYGIKINHIVTLNEEEYKEECISDIEPLWSKKIIAVHTLNFVNEMTIVDGLMKRSRYPSAIIRKFRKLYR